MLKTTDPSEHSAGSGRASGETLDAFHEESLRALDKLAWLSRRLVAGPADAAARELAAKLIEHFSIAERLHHEEEERNVFPALLASGDPDLARTVAQLRRDHQRIARDWLEIEPHLDAVASGQLWYDTDVIREGAAVFGALMHEHFEVEDSIVQTRRQTAFDADQAGATLPVPGNRSSLER